MINDWRPYIVRVVQIQQALAQADVHGVWEYHFPKVAASADDLAAAEDHLGLELDAGYRGFLGYGNGWPSFYQDIALFGTEDLMGGPRLELAHQALDAIDPAVFEQAGLQRDALLPIAASAVEEDVFVSPIADGKQLPVIVWLANGEVQRYESFEDYVLWMMNYNEKELNAMKEG